VIVMPDRVNDGDRRNGSRRGSAMFKRVTADGHGLTLSIPENENPVPLSREESMVSSSECSLLP
jgi:hypothetical protein